jgi:hypothetical protein
MHCLIRHLFYKLVGCMLIIGVGGGGGGGEGGEIPYF